MGGSSGSAMEPTARFGGGSTAGTSQVLGKGWAGGDARVGGTNETIQTQPQPCRPTVPGATGAGPCVWESTDVSLSDEFKAFSFSVCINGEWPLAVGTDDQAAGWLFHHLEPWKMR